jgi:hypothetical protein
MLKISDACVFIQKKIERNNILIEIFGLSKDVLQKEISMKENIMTFYDEQTAAVKLINEIEVMQIEEYTTERQDKINDLTKNIGIYQVPDDIKSILVGINATTIQIKNKSEQMHDIQKDIPKQGTATNYKLYTYDPTETCGGSTRNFL